MEKLLEPQVLESSESRESALSTAETCEFLNISRQTLYKLVKTQRLPGHKIGDKYRFFKTEILRFFDHGE
ncbi:MAG: helix-turn-helix domain-containing protein [Candidatus Omnitrophica bacterium]|nr:helix-turn-helix domain-containing protein [Candidatus Omnitrophota bacterium]